MLVNQLSPFFSITTCKLIITGYCLTFAPLPRVVIDLKMATEVEIVTPPNRTAQIWKHFGFKRDSSGKLSKSECKVCKQSVAHGGGMNNLRNHLRTAHSSLYIELLSGDSHGQSSLDKQEKLDSVLHQ